MIDAQAGVRDFLIETGIAAAGDPVTLTPLAGGVSSDIWRVTAGSRTVCVKRALPVLRVAGRWEAPISRNSFEWAWLQTAAAIVPHITPELYGHDAAAGLIVMEYLEPDRYPVWKVLLRDGVVSLATARDVGRRLGTIHAATAGNPTIGEQFATDDLFFALRLKPYLLDTAAKHPDLAGVLADIADVTAATKRVLVHGDVSPKNILVGADGPKLIDAECAWYGDPAFDLAFVLNHLLLKCVWRPMHSHDYIAAFRTLASAYLRHVDWEPVDQLEARCARLLPALLLARIDGTSPVEYLTAERDRDAVRGRARELLRTPRRTFEGIVAAWPP